VIDNVDGCHAKTHAGPRQWAMTTFNLFAQAEASGLAYVDELLEAVSVTVKAVLNSYLRC
jgi:hypothetical protein